MADDVRFVKPLFDKHFRDLHGEIVTLLIAQIMTVFFRGRAHLVLDGKPLAGRETGIDEERRGRNLRYFGFLVITGVLFIKVLFQRFYGNIDLDTNKITDGKLPLYYHEKVSEKLVKTF